jgi:cell division ATPase FtsA
VRREIKEAECGSKFSPILLITGGGAEMQNIEQLFARELKVEEARSVYPEYGFTESMGEHITTRAYATIASLLLRGAQRGTCVISTRVPNPTQPQQPQEPQQPTFAPRPVITPRPVTPKPEEPVVETGTLGTVDPEVASETEGEIEIEVGSGKTKEGKLNKFMNKITELFTGKDDEYTF